ncbi:CBM35 domain-containing protein [Embleya sp. AB8]|uniref:CBM35 domain-containing protein n=1 Tax=Embleya sp. AB8 TaxID=3156304 RepID=UPI003C7895EE
MNYGQPPAHTQPQAAIPAQHEHGGAPPPQQAPPTRGGGKGGGRGAIIAAVVAVVVVIGVVAVLLTNNSGDDKDKKAKTPVTTGGVQTSSTPSQPATQPAAPSTAPGGKFAVLEAKDAAPSGGAALVPGVTNSAGGNMVDMQVVGSTVTLKVTPPKAGTYYLAVRYLNPAPSGDQQTLSIIVNGTNTKKQSMLKSWGTGNSVTGTWNNVTLVDGANEIQLTCTASDKCKASLDQIWVSDQKPDFK